MSEEPIPCRVCFQPAEFMFRKRLLGSIAAAYFGCTSCGHVQTEPPYWLDRAYHDLNFRRDTGMVDRCLWAAKSTVALAQRMEIGTDRVCLDWGAGTGLFVRICRDHGMNFFYHDRYAENIFARGFEFADSEHERIALITAFEVFEHFPDPGPRRRLTALISEGEAREIRPRDGIIYRAMHNRSPSYRLRSSFGSLKEIRASIRWHTVRRPGLGSYLGFSPKRRTPSMVGPKLIGRSSVVLPWNQDRQSRHSSVPQDRPLAFRPRTAKAITCAKLC